MTLQRLPDWDRRLPRVIAHHRDAPPAWGASDCWMLAMDAHEAVTGARILPHLQRYRTEAGGYRVFRRHGFDTVEEALASVLEPVGILSAQRGDLCTIERDGLVSSGVLDAEGIAVKAIVGEGKTILRGDLRHFPITAARRAFKVGRS